MRRRYSVQAGAARDKRGLHMNHKHMSGLIILALLFAGCGGKKADVGEGEKKLADTQKQLEEAKSQPGAEQKVAELEKQLADAKKQLAESKDAPATPAPAPVEPDFTA